jgi:hypothetical protein
MTGVFEKEHRGRCSFKGEGIVTPCFPQFVINHKIGITMLMHEDNVNVLLFELPMTDCGGEALKVLAMISLEEEFENYKRGFIMTNNPKFPLMRMTTSFGSQGKISVDEERTGG